jgi:hypothetical protein
VPKLFIVIDSVSLGEPTLTLPKSIKEEVNAILAPVKTIRDV